jgi:SAM-dependent methyltransferase
MTRPCPLCNGKSESLFESHGYWVNACGECRHRFAEVVQAQAHVERTYGDDYFRAGGAGYPDYLAEGAILRAHGRRYGELLQRFLPLGSLLDVGSAAGFVLAGFNEAGWCGRGIEPNASMSSHAREELGLRVFTGTLDDYEEDSRFDVVSLVQVLAHFVDPVRALRRAASLTGAGGYWLIETWNRQSWTARLSGRRWHEYSPPSVLHWFTPESVQHLAARFGFREVARGRPSKRLSSRHAKSLLEYKLGTGSAGKLIGPALKLFPDHLRVPYPAEDLFWMLLRKTEGTRIP